MTDPFQSPGRSCPIAYRYGADALAQSADVECDTLLVVGGLYGNPYALQTVLDMAAQEQGKVRLCFNGDFNWFNVTPEWFDQINRIVLQHDCIVGNVEAELGAPLDQADCGCAYPDSVPQCVVDRSNQIHLQLKALAQRTPHVLTALVSQPMFKTYRVGRLRVGVVHGDADSLSGWRFDPAALNDSAENTWRVQAFERAAVDVFASSHTCSAAFHVQALKPGTALAGVVSNNGAAGMPSVKGRLSGLVTRVSTHAGPHEVHRFYGMKGGVIEQVFVDYNQENWAQFFLNTWPQGSPAYLNYFDRITGVVAEG